ncbi:DNA alkylation repair protein [Candidatus Uhrbacteria bacterium]|nr:DNA alkylation repair protein [Candidatus Uhrbacteria bacterium]
MSLRAIRNKLKTAADPKKAAFLPSFFKTGKGEYGEGDRFIGVTVPKIRGIAREHAKLSLKEIELLLKSPIHEERLLAVIILSNQYARAEEKQKEALYRFYLKNAKRVNNWDLVDSSAHKIVGPHLDGKDDKILDALANSKNLWEKRIAIISTFYFIYKGDCSKTYRIADLLMKDEHDLIHKAVGWMLRETGKRCSEVGLERYLEPRAAKMPRTMLRYAIEKMLPSKRAHYLALKRVS